MATPADLKARFPEFAAVDDARVQYWLTDAARIVTDGWGADEDVGLILLAAHNLAAGGALATGQSFPVGVTSFKSGTFSIGFSDASAAAQAAGGYGSTRYGIMFRSLLRVHAGGPFLAEAVAPCHG